MNKGVILFCFILLGCASLDYRTGTTGAVNSGVYPGTRWDAKNIHSITSGEYQPWITEIWPFHLTASILDLPLSFVLDTICLPYDLTRKHRCEVEEEERFSDILGRNEDAGVLKTNNENF
jgi:uncharacterized protein YceK